MCRVQVSPLRVNALGVELAPPPLPVNPISTDSPRAIAWLYGMAVAATSEPDCFGVAFHISDTVCPLGNFHCSVQPETSVVPVLRMVTSVRNPPGHVFVTWYSTEQPVTAFGAGGGVVVPPGRGVTGAAVFGCTQGGPHRPSFLA